MSRLTDNPLSDLIGDVEQKKEKAPTPPPAAPRKIEKREEPQQKKEQDPEPVQDEKIIITFHTKRALKEDLEFLKAVFGHRSLTVTINKAMEDYAKKNLPAHEKLREQIKLIRK